MESVFDLQGELHIRVDFFDNEEREKLLLYPTAIKIKEIVSSGARVSIAQFLTYYLFHKKRPGKDGYRSYTELSRRISRAVTDIEDWVRYQDGSFISSPDAIPQDRAITERIGEAAALSLMGKIHTLHDADWDRIPEQRGRKATPTFDYQDIACASDGERIVQVEAKGTAVENAAEVSVNVKQHKRDIDQKKLKISSLEKEGSYLHPADLRYGVICSLGKRGPLQCWLTDPSVDAERNPLRYRLLRRLEFMFNWVSFLSSRSQLAASFATRLRALETLDDPFLLDNVPLLRGNGERFQIASLNPFEKSASFFAHLCQVTDGPTVGTIIRLSDGRLFFLGVQIRIFEMAATQGFNAIMNYADLGGSVRKTVRCVLSRGRARNMGIAQLHDGRDQSSPYVSFNAEGILHYSQGSAVFGIITPKPSPKNLLIRWD